MKDFKFLEQTYTRYPSGVPTAVTILGRHPDGQGWVYYFGHGPYGVEHFLGWDRDACFIDPEPTITIDGKTYREADVVERCRELKPL